MSYASQKFAKRRRGSSLGVLFGAMLFSMFSGIAAPGAPRSMRGGYQVKSSPEVQKQKIIAAQQKRLRKQRWRLNHPCCSFPSFDAYLNSDLFKERHA